MKDEIIHIALENLNQFAAVQAEWNNNGPLDGVLELNVNGHTHTFIAEVKREVRNYQLPQVEELFHRN